MNACAIIMNVQLWVSTRGNDCTVSIDVFDQGILCSLTYHMTSVPEYTQENALKPCVIFTGV